MSSRQLPLNDEIASIQFQDERMFAVQSSLSVNLTLVLAQTRT